MGSLGFIAGLCTSGAVIPQIWHMVRVKSARDFSWAMLGIATIGQVFWIAHGSMLRDPAILTFASFNLLVNGCFSVIKVSTCEELQKKGSWWVKCFTVRSLVPLERISDGI